MKTIENEIIEVVTTMTNAFNSRNIEGVMSSYEKGAAVMFQPKEPIRDEKMIEEMFQGAFSINPKFQYPNGHEVYVANDIAMHIALWTMEGVAPDGAKLKDSGLSVAILRKTNDKWLMVLDNPHSQVSL